MRPSSRPLSDLLLRLTALGLGALLAARALLRADPSWDTWMYHLPFAGRLWGIVTPGEHILPPYLEDRYRGVPLLGEWVQGFLWWLTGRPEAANLLALASLFLYLGFLARYLRVPWPLGLLALAAIPLVQVHATTGYVDLPASVAFSVLVLLTYLLYTRDGFATRGHLLLMLLAAALGANIKFQLVPLTPVVLAFVALRLAWLARGRWGEALHAAGGGPRLALVTGLALAVVFAVPLKNLALHGNPVYPLQMQVLGITLEGPEVLPAEKEMASIHFVPVYLEDTPAPQRWLYSLLEVGVRPYSDPKRWSVDQFMPHGSTGTMMGGYSAPYVVLNLVLLAYLVGRLRTREAWAAAVLMGVASAAVSAVPQSHELRYTLFWMLTLVSLNLYLVGRLQERGDDGVATLRSVGLGAFAALALTLAVTRGQYLDPRPHPVERLVDVKVDRTIMAKIRDGDRVCFSHEPWTVLYTAPFHPPLRYSLKETGREDDCGPGRHFLGLAKFGPN
jgi:hypothetical protein